MPRLWAALFLLMVASASLATAKTYEDVEYGRVGSVSLLLDARVPDGPGPFPAVILVHGGGWVRGDRKIDVRPLFQPLANAGFAWFSISYRFANNALLFGSAVHDVEQAIQYVRAHAQEYNIDPERIALVGESAGAQLASMAALEGSAGTAVRGVVAFYCPCDLDTLARTSAQVPASIRDAIKNSAYGPIIAEGLRQLSPVNHISADMPPFLLIHGTQDSLVPFEQSQTFCTKMRDAGASCELYPVKGAGHGIRWWDDTNYQRVMVGWLKKRLD